MRHVTADTVNQDNETYRRFLEPNGWKIQVDDYILDSFTASSYPNRIMLTKAAEQFKNLKEGSTIWYDCEKLKDFQCINLSNQTGGGYEWHVNTVYFKPIPNAQLLLKFGPESYNGSVFRIHGVKYPKIKFRSVQYPDLDANTIFQRDGWGGYFDLEGKHDDKGHAIMVTCPPGGFAEIDGLSAGGGCFSIRRTQDEQTHGVVKSKTYSFYAHTSDSETLYDGMTTKIPYVAYEDYRMDRMLAARSGSESFQIQHLRGGAKIGKLYAHNAAFLFPKNFQRYQTSAFQLMVDCGNNVIDSVFVNGFAENGLNLSSTSGYSLASGTFSGPKPGDETVFNRVYLYGGHRAIYLHNSCSNGMTWRIKELWVGGMNDRFAQITGEPKINHYLTHAGTDKVIIEKLIHDGSRPNIASNLSKFEIHEVVLDSNFPVAKYKYTHRQFTNWSQYIANYHPAPDNTLMTYKAGEYVTDRENGKPTVYCKVLKDHTATSVRPKNDPVNFLPLTVDESGKWSDEPGWTSSLRQRSYPTDNFEHLPECPLKSFYFKSDEQSKDEIIMALSTQLQELAAQVAELEAKNAELAAAVDAELKKRQAAIQLIKDILTQLEQ